MEHKKTSSRIYHVPDEETKGKGKGKRKCRGPLSLKIQPHIGIEFTHCTIMFSRKFL